MFFITEEQKSNIIQLLYRYCDAANVEKYKHKKEMDYNDKLMELMLNHSQQYPIECDQIFNHIQSKYKEHRKKYEDLCLMVSSLELLTIGIIIQSLNTFA